MQKIILIGQLEDCQEYKEKFLAKQHPYFEVVIIDENDIPANIEEIKKGNGVIIKPSIKDIPITAIKHFDVETLSEELNDSFSYLKGKKNRKSKKWQPPYKYHP